MRNMFLDNKYDLKDDTKTLNNRAWDYVLNRYMLKALNVYKWENLPPNVDSFYIEMLLFKFGCVGFAYDEERGWLTLQVNAYNFMDINYRPVQASLIGMGYVKNYNVYWGEDALKTIVYNDKPFLDKDNTCVIIKNNDLYIPTYNLLEYKLYQLYNIERATDVELIQLPLQNLIVGSTQDRNSINELFNKIKRHEPFNAIASGQMKGELQGLSLNHEFKGLELQEMKRNVEGEIYTILGLNNVNYEKKERLVTGEVEANNESIENELQASLRTRENACKLINEFFGTNISVSVNKVEETESKGEKLNGEYEEENI